jgi:hypothetical protein
MPESYKLHINCGGEAETINGSIVYDADIDQSGPSKFYKSPQNSWAFSSTGHFMEIIIPN